NAVIHPLFDKARAQAASELPNGPFRGVPFMVKDLFAPTAGDPIHNGMRVLRDAGSVASDDVYVTARYRRAGFVFVGRTNTPELGLLPTTEPLAHGATRNPWDVSRSPGGSSGGSAAAIASGMVPVAHASDGGGSIRIPASGAAVRAAAAVLESLGHHVEDSHPAVLDRPAENVASFLTRWSTTARLGLQVVGRMVGRELTAADVEPYTWVMAEMANGVSGVDLARALAASAAFTRSLAGWWAGGFDLLLTPTLGSVPPRAHRRPPVSA